MSFNHQARQFFSKYVDYFMNQQKGLDEAFETLLDFVSKFKVPSDFSGITIQNDVDFFAPDKGQPVFYDLVSRLVAKGIRTRDVTSWKRPRQAPVQGQAQAQVTESLPLQESRGILDKLSGMGSGIVDLLSGPDLSELGESTQETEDPDLHLVKIYRRGCVMVESYNRGMAEGQLGKVRQAIALYVTGLMRDRTDYTNGQLLEIGGQVTSVASG